MSDRAVLALVRLWCFVRYPRVVSRTFRRTRVLPNPASPVSDVDKFLWRKLFDHSPLFVVACDKLAAKGYALSICPDLRTARVLWLGDDARAIPEALLEGNVVVKANHGSRRNIMVRNGEVDRAGLYAKTKRWLRRPYGRSLGEWAYRKVPRRLLVEEMLMEDGEPVRTEYKFHVSGGRTAYLYVARKRDDGAEQWCCFERDGRRIPLATDYPNWLEMELPPVFERMRRDAETLSQPFDHVRCDFYALDGEVWFSELTVYPLSGQGVVNPYLSRLRNDPWDLRKSWFLTAPQKRWRKVYAAALRRWLDVRAMVG